MTEIDDTLKYVIDALNQAEAHLDDAEVVLARLVDNTKNLVAADAASDIWYQLGWVSHSAEGLKHKIVMTRARVERELGGVQAKGRCGSKPTAVATARRARGRDGQAVRSRLLDISRIRS